jgi:outer membrane biosynthesis protein TonB
MQKTCAVVCMTLFAFGASAQEKKPKIEPKLEIIEDEPSKPATLNPKKQEQAAPADAKAADKPADEKAAEPAAAEAKAEPAKGDGAKKGAGGDVGAKPAAAMALEGEVASTAEAPPPVPQGEEKAAIASYIRDQTGDVHRCYEKRLDDRPTLQGKLYVILYIGPSGRVIGATTQGLDDNELVKCVLPYVRKWEFDKPKSGGKLMVKYPFVFKPVSRN